MPLNADSKTIKTLGSLECQNSVFIGPFTAQDLIELMKSISSKI